MARFDTSGLEEMIAQMHRLGQMEGPVAEQMVTEAVGEIKKAWQESAQAHGHYRTGNLVGSIKPGPGPVHAGDIIYQDVYPQGTNDHGARNAEVAFILNYGCKRFPGSYWVEEADANSEGPVNAVCQQIWDSFLASAGS